jgi:hypothetical protein
MGITAMVEAFLTISPDSVTHIYLSYGFDQSLRKKIFTIFVINVVRFFVLDIRRFLTFVGSMRSMLTAKTVWSRKVMASGGKFCPF